MEIMASTGKYDGGNLFCESIFDKYANDFDIEGKYTYKYLESKKLMSGKQKNTSHNLLDSSNKNKTQQPKYHIIFYIDVLLATQVHNFQQTVDTFHKCTITNTPFKCKQNFRLLYIPEFVLLEFLYINSLLHIVYTKHAPFIQN